MKMFALLLFLSALPIAAHAAIDFGRHTARTPYDRHLAPVQSTLQRGGSATLSMEEARSFLKIARGFRYQMDEAYRPQPPAETEQQQAGDCKDKSLWLLHKLGGSRAHFVVGKARTNSAINHAWLLWQKEGRWWILDPTNASEPIAADTIGMQAHIPLYSYTRGGKRIHAAAAGLRGEAVRVAAGGSR
jgi:hypothetical protein